MRSICNRISSWNVGTCRSLVVAVGALWFVASAVWGDEASQPSDVDISTPTHHQVGIIQANVDGQPQVALQCFALTPENKILAGCLAGEVGEIRVFDAEGKYLETWSVPVKPEAIFVRGDGNVFLAGDGQLVQLSSTGRLERQSEAPHAKLIHENRDKIREEVIAQTKQMANMLAEQSKVYDQMIEQSDKQIAQIREQIAALEEAEKKATSEDQADEGETPREATSASLKKRMLERRLASRERTKKQYEEAKAQFAEMAKQNPAEELTEEQIEEKVKSSLAYKLKASSISATEDEVYLATHSAVGYGFEVWRMDDEFNNGQRIVSELRGCCGQMDVKVNEHGLFVAENSQHRVCRYNRDGKLITTWGQGAREGLEGFGSCCNPMNVAFGPGDAVYTAEDNTGRIKRYSVEGKLLGLVGSVELVPGCKNVSIAVNEDGSRVYMLDITRHHIVRMEPYAPGEAPAAADKQKGARPSSSDVGSAVVEGLKAIFSLAH